MNQTLHTSEKRKSLIHFFLFQMLSMALQENQQLGYRSLGISINPLFKLKIPAARISCPLLRFWTKILKQKQIEQASTCFKMKWVQQIVMEAGEALTFLQ